MNRPRCHASPNAPGRNGYASVMSHSHAWILVHCVFSTKERANLIPDPNELCKYITGVARAKNITLLAAGGVPNHTHLLIALSPAVPLAKVVQELKGNSSRWLNERGVRFAWQQGYGAFGVGQSQKQAVCDYIARQEEHHKKWSFEQQLMTRLRKSGQIPWLRPDAKTQVSIEYDGYKPVRATTVVVSSQHAEDVKQKEVRETLTELLIKKVMPAEWLDAKTTYLINPTGRFVIGGPEGDAGITGRKIICDTYGGMGRHGGGAFSGKDPTKVDRSAAYMGRWVAKNVVASGLADRCEVQFAYAIGHPEPVSVSVDTFCTGKVDEEKLERAIWEVFNFKPAEIIKQLNLLRPIYRKTTNYGHFGRIDDLDAITWEKTNKAEALKKAVR